MKFLSANCKTNRSPTSSTILQLNYAFLSAIICLIYASFQHYFKSTVSIFFTSENNVNLQLSSTDCSIWNLIILLSSAMHHANINPISSSQSKLLLTIISIQRSSTEHCITSLPAIFSILQPNVYSSIHLLFQLNWNTFNQILSLRPHLLLLQLIIWFSELCYPQALMLLFTSWIFSFKTWIVSFYTTE